MIDFHIHSYFSDGDQSPKEVVEIAKRRRLSAIAITDHCDISGQFMYLRDISKPRPLREYIDEVRNLPPVDFLEVFLGIEISGYSSNSAPPSEFAELDFILVETFPAQTPMQQTFDPIEKVLELKKNYTVPVGLAHPTLPHIERNIEVLDKNGIFIELNVDKLIANPKEQEHVLQRTAELLHSYPSVKISVGSDAHIIFIIGAVKPIWEFLVRNDFLNRVILIS